MQFVLLVISTISMISEVSTLASKHLSSLGHCPYCTRPTSIIGYHSNTCHPHHSNQKYILLTLLLLFSGGDSTITTLGSSGTIVCSSGSSEDDEGATNVFGRTVCHSYYNVQQYCLYGSIGFIHPRIFAGSQ